MYTWSDARRKFKGTEAWKVKRPTQACKETYYSSDVKRSILKHVKSCKFKGIEAWKIMSPANASCLRP